MRGEEEAYVFKLVPLANQGDSPWHLGAANPLIGGVTHQADTARQCTLPHDEVFGLLGLLPQTISSKITIDYNQVERKLLFEFTTAISIANENSGNLEGAGDVNMQSTTGNSMYALEDVPGKGKGLVAIEKISKGTRIPSEEPIITIPRNEMNSERLQISTYQQVATLSEHQQRAFLSMHNIHPYRDAAERYLGIVQTNSLPAETDGDKGAIFLEACRINHTCDNNAQKNWDENIKRHSPCFERP